MSAGAKRRTIVRYTLFQIPDLILLCLGLAAAVRWLNLPVIAAYGLVAAWIAKDIILFPVLRIAYESNGSSESRGVRGALAVVTQPLVPAGAGPTVSPRAASTRAGPGGVASVPSRETSGAAESEARQRWHVTLPSGFS